jgi:hypothetical protein
MNNITLEGNAHRGLFLLLPQLVDRDRDVSICRCTGTEVIILSTLPLGGDHNIS